MVGTPVSQLVDLVSAGVHKVSGPVPPSPSASSSTVEGQWAPYPSGHPKRAHHAPTTSTCGAPREQKVPSQEVPLLTGPPEAITGSSGSSQLLSELQGSPPVPCHIPQLTLPAGYFKHINLKCFGKLYLCQQCKKQTSN